MVSSYGFIAVTQFSMSLCDAWYSPALRVLLCTLPVTMPETAQILSSFPTARCDVCDRYVLTYLDFDGARDLRRCVHCDATLVADLHWINASELESEGYQFVAGTKAGGGQCASGCGTCSVRKH
jgi:hypothetical protein